MSTTEPNYWSGEDYVVEFLGYRFGFGAQDFEQRVTAAAVKLGLLEGNELDEDETGDLVELAADGVIQEARSGLGRYLVRHWERVSLVGDESLVYWLRKLVFRGAWLDHRVKEGLLEVAFDERNGEFGYRDPRGGAGAARARARALVARAAVPPLIARNAAHFARVSAGAPAARVPEFLRSDSPFFDALFACTAAKPRCWRPLITERL